MLRGRRASVFAATLVALGAIALSGAALAQYTAGTLSSNQNTYTLGETGTATGTNLTANRDYELVLDQNPTVRLDTGTTTAAGAVFFAFRIPTTQFAAGAAALIARPTTGQAAQATKAIQLLAAQASPTASPVAGAPRLVPNRTSYTPGQRGTATGSNLTANENYHLDFIQSPGILLVRANTNANGTVSFSFTIPSGARNGAATLRTHPTDNTGEVATAAITITGAAADGISLPRTGRDILIYVGIGILLVLAGALMIAWVRHRRRLARELAEQLRPSETTRV